MVTIPVFTADALRSWDGDEHVCPDHALPTKQAKSPAAMPLYVDLDGTLIRSDAAQEMLIATLRKPDGIRALLRAAMNRDVTQIKRVSADHALLDAARLPYNAEVVDYLAEARAEGRRVVLATAADAKVAHAVADHLGVFDAVIATEPGANQKGKVKLAAIKRDCGDAPFEYLGDSDADLPIWQAAAGRGFVNPTGKAYDASKQAGDALTVLVQDKPDSAARPDQGDAAASMGEERFGLHPGSLCPCLWRSENRIFGLCRFRCVFGSDIRHLSDQRSL